eukprot:gene9911-11737_t
MERREAESNATSRSNRARRQGAPVAVGARTKQQEEEDIFGHLSPLDEWVLEDLKKTDAVSSQQSSDAVMQNFVKVSSNRTLAMILKPSHTVARVLEELVSRGEALSSDEIVLYHKHTRLNTVFTLRDYGVPPGATLRLLRKDFTLFYT